MIRRDDMFNMLMKFKATKFDGMFEATNSSEPCFVEFVPTIGWVATFDKLNAKGNVVGGEEEYFKTAKDAIKWLETKVSFTVEMEKV